MIGRVSHRWSLAGIAAATFLLAGCRGVLVGDWHLIEAVPSREVFSIDNATFRGDGTFSATSTIEGLTANERGTYDFNGIKLKLRPQAGGQRTYSATLKLNRLELLDGKRRVVLAKGGKGG